MSNLKERNQHGRVTVYELPEEVVKKAENARNYVTQNFKNFVKERNWKNRDVVDRFGVFVSDESHVCKLLSGNRPITYEILVILHHAYGIDLNAFVAGGAIEKFYLSAKAEDFLLGLADSILAKRKGV